MVSTELLRGFPFFAELTDEELKSIAMICNTLFIPWLCTVFSRHDSGGGMRMMSISAEPCTSFSGGCVLIIPQEPVSLLPGLPWLL